MQIPIPEHWKILWNKWDLRAFIFLSLFLQTFLVLVAPLRKRTSRSWIIMPLWSAYLLADWAANFAVGLISSSESDNVKDSNGTANNGDLLAFWAPFLLVHLGGPYEPFVIATQVIQVFYANPVSTKAKGWSTVITTKARNTYDVAENSNEETYQEEEFHDFDLYNIDEQTQNLILLDDSQFAEEVDPSLPEAGNEDRECSDEDDNEYFNDDEYSEEEEEDDDIADDSEKE